MERLKALAKRTAPVKWVFLGDSITHGALHTFGWRDYVELFEERLRYELGRGMDIVIKTAISGHSTRHLLTTLEWRVKQFNPDAVFLMIGMNDCSVKSGISIEEFTGNLHRLADEIAQAGALLVMQTTCTVLPVLSGDREANFDVYMEAIRQVARERGLPLIDHTEYWKERAARTIYWMSDAFHPNEFGHRAFAECLHEAMGIHDPGSPIGKLNIP
jgi:lysophospholipase L1-like esterase